MRKISFILPIYNVEDYLRECVDSIVNQINDNSCEVIMVDDGSTDSCKEIVDWYDEKYDFVNVIHKTNGGLASARNAGLKKASGKYVAFVDADDILEPNSIEKILIWSDNTDADICFMKAVKIFPTGKKLDLGEKIYKRDIVNKSRSEVLQYLSSCPKFPGSACFKLYKRSFLENNNILFPSDNRRSEDLGFAFDCLTSAEKFDVLEVPYYMYRQSREGSITDTKITEKSFMDLGKFIEESVEKATTRKKPKSELYLYSMSFVAYEYMILLMHFNKLSREDKKKTFDFLKKYRWVTRYAGNNKIRVLSIILRVLGIKTTSFLLYEFIRHRYG